MVFRSYELKKNILWKEVSRETNQAYKDWVKELQKNWRVIKAIVCDWKKWILWWFWEIPTQMCHFHQKQIMKRYLTQNPRVEANKELKEIWNSIWNFSMRTIKQRLDDWYRRNKSFLSERNDANKLVHNRTLKAYRSLNRNLKYLYTYKDYEWIIDIPNTTNSIESTFSHVKQKANLHRWLKKKRKLKVLDQFLWK